ncbi:MAG: MFS transporter [Synergistaceae bacterium]|nr:MFS transporter [Synergistaceae bacterium]
MNGTKKILSPELGYILIFFSITFISASMESGYYFLLPYLEGRGISLGALGGVAIGICYGVSSFSRPLVPLFEQRLGDDKMLWGGYACFFISAAGVALFSGAMGSVIAWRGIFGLGLSMVGVSLTAYERRFIPEKIRGRSIALITTAYNLPSLVIVPVMEFLITREFYRCYIFFFPLLIAAGTAAVRKLPKIGNDESQAAGEKDGARLSYISLLRNPQIALFAASAALFALTDAGQLTFVQLSGELGLAASYFFSVSAGTALLFRILCGKLIDLLPRKICAAGATSITAAMMLMMTTVSSPSALMLYGFIFGIGIGFGYPAFMCLILDLGGRRYVTRLAVVFGLIYSGLFFLTPVIMEFFIGMTGSAALAYRIIYGGVLLATAAIVPVSAKVYKKTNTIQEW